MVQARGRHISIREEFADVGHILYIQTLLTRVSILTLRRRRSNFLTLLSRRLRTTEDGWGGSGERLPNLTQAVVFDFHGPSPTNRPSNRLKTSRSATPFVANTRTPPVPSSPSLTSLEAIRLGAYFKACNSEPLYLPSFTLQMYDRLMTQKCLMNVEI